MCSLSVKICVTVIFALIATVNCKIPDYISVCPQTHQNLSACIIESIEGLRPHMVKGFTEIGAPGIEPLELGKITIDSIGEGSQLATNLSNFKIWGASNFKILKLTHKLTKNGRTFKFEITIPRLHVEGDYEMDSKILFVNLKGHGPFNANITNYHIECLMKGQKVERNGHNHLLFEDIKCNLLGGETNVHFDNLFNGNAVLGQATNDVINDNSQVLLGEVRPQIGNAIRKRFTEIANKITLAFTYEELFP